MTIWIILGIVFVAGALGGVVNALLTDNGFILPLVNQLTGTPVSNDVIKGQLPNVSASNNTLSNPLTLVTLLILLQYVLGLPETFA